jgi:hypothetical protein
VSTIDRNGNGRSNGEADHEHVKAAIAELQASTTTDDANDTEGTDTSDTPITKLDRAARNPGDDGETLNKLAQALEVPKENRDLGTSAGKTTAAVPIREVFGEDQESGPLGRALNADAIIRGGAEQIESLQGSIADEELCIGTEPDVKKLLADRAADEKAAQRLLGPREDLVREQAEKKNEIKETERLLEEANVVVDKERDDDMRIPRMRRSQPANEPDTAPERTSGYDTKGKPRRLNALPLLGKVFASPKLMMAFGVADILLVMFLLQSSVTQALNAAPLPAFAVAAGVSLGVQAGGAIGGFMLAAARLPVRVVALVLAVGFVVMAFMLLDASETLREDPSDTAGLATFMWCTALSAYVAFTVSYAYAVYQDAAEFREEAASIKQLNNDDHDIIRRAGSRLEDAIKRRDGLIRLLERLFAELSQITVKIDELDVRKEALLDSAARADAAAADRIGQHARAIVRLSIRQKTLDSAKSQEKASSAKALALAWLLHRKTNVEEIAEAPAEVLGAGTAKPWDEEPEERRNLGAALAIGALAIGGGLGLLLQSPAVFAIGAVIAAIALLFPRIPGRRRGIDRSASGGPDTGGIHSATDVRSRVWTRQPDHTISSTTRDDDQHIERA